MAPRKLSISDAETIANRGKPWTFRLEYHGSTSNGNPSHKFWYATGRGITEEVEVGWGALGGLPQNQLIGWNELRNRVTEKLSKGYDYAPTDYIRMSAASLAQLGMPVLPSLPSAVAPPVVVQTPVPPRPGWLTGAPPPAPSTGVKYTKTPSASLLSLNEPWSLIRCLKMQRTGSKLTGYNALDENGDELLLLDAATGLDFATKHDIEVEF